jgi:AraC family transcriptional regulator of adaptative response/methylated-DNA-[protein]-cysteine methyltransferase
VKTDQSMHHHVREMRLDETRSVIRYFLEADDDRGHGNLRALVKGTPFQVRVWRALLRVPSGTLVTYGNLAAAIGQPMAARAVGSAVGKNNLAYLIPCHRVIRKTGVIGDYRWGPSRKRAIVAWESGKELVGRRYA